MARPEVTREIPRSTAPGRLQCPGSLPDGNAVHVATYYGCTTPWHDSSHARVSAITSPTSGDRRGTGIDRRARLGQDRAQHVHHAPVPRPRTPHRVRRPQAPRRPVGLPGSRRQRGGGLQRLAAVGAGAASVQQREQLGEHRPRARIVTASQIHLGSPGEAHHQHATQPGLASTAHRLHDEDAGSIRLGPDQQHRQRGLSVRDVHVAGHRRPYGLPRTPPVHRLHRRRPQRSSPAHGGTPPGARQGRTAGPRGTPCALPRSRPT